MVPLMNNTKWDELRLAMYNLGDLHPRWRTKDVSGFISPWDGEWFYHFQVGGYASVEWVEVQIQSGEQDEAVLALLRLIHLPGHRIEHGFRVYGYVPAGTSMDYI